MKNYLAAFALAVGFCFASPSYAADRNYTVTGFNRVRVEGPYAVRLTTGIAPFARASGSQAGLESISIAVEGQTLVVRPNRSSWGGYPGKPFGKIDIAIGSHELAYAAVNGSGSLAINRIKGLSFDLVVQGSGAAIVASASVDDLKVGITGTGSISIAGTALKLTALIRGASSLDAGALRVKDATIGAEGAATIKATATSTAKIDARGAVSIELDGNPACTVKTMGSASVSGCR